MITRAQIKDVLKFVKRSPWPNCYYKGYSKGVKNVTNKDLGVLHEYWPRDILFGWTNTQTPICIKILKLRAIKLPQHWYNKDLMICAGFHELMHAMDNESGGKDMKGKVCNEIAAELGALCLCMENGIDEDAIIFNSIFYIKNELDVFRWEAGVNEKKVISKVFKCIKKLEKIRRNK